MTDVAALQRCQTRFGDPSRFHMSRGQAIFSDSKRSSIMLIRLFNSTRSSYISATDGDPLRRDSSEIFFPGRGSITPNGSSVAGRNSFDSTTDSTMSCWTKSWTVSRRDGCLSRNTSDPGWNNDDSSLEEFSRGKSMLGTVPRSKFSHGNVLELVQQYWIW